MPYLIEKSDGTRTLVQMTAEEANYRAGIMPVFEVAEDEVTIIGQVHVKPEALEKVSGDELPAASTAQPDLQKEMERQEGARAQFDAKTEG
ncbi:MAG TPA: hypothetical protein VFM48_08260 [Aquabacterium sp.]|nr:hypothetical protein [Aquabacterium sp.]